MEHQLYGNKMHIAYLRRKRQYMPNNDIILNRTGESDNLCLQDIYSMELKSILSKMCWSTLCITGECDSCTLRIPILERQNLQMKSPFNLLRNYLNYLELLFINNYCLINTVYSKHKINLDKPTKESSCDLNKTLLCPRDGKQLKVCSQNPVYILNETRKISNESQLSIVLFTLTPISIEPQLIMTLFCNIEAKMNRNVIGDSKKKLHRKEPKSPSPPYMPLDQRSPITKFFPSEDRLKMIIFRNTEKIFALYGNTVNGNYGERKQSLMKQKITNIYDRVIIEICREIMEKIKKSLIRNEHSNFHSLQNIKKYAHKEVRDAFFMFKIYSSPSQELDLYCDKAKRDNIEKVIMKDIYDEEVECSCKENSVVESIFDEMKKLHRKEPKSPSPPYMPLDQRSPITKFFPSEDRLKMIIFRNTEKIFALYGNTVNGNYGERKQSLMKQKITNIYDRVIIEICREIMEKIKKSLIRNEHSNFHSLQNIKKYAHKEVRDAFFMFKICSSPSQELDLYCDKAKRDNIEKVIMKDIYDEEVECSCKENSVVESIFDEMVGSYAKQIIKYMFKRICLQVKLC
ncbi:uncharacterized protein Atf6 isoform X3 [Drosophila pseudoobscura]|nr:uncharacterized protein LOC4811771 isoform X3 [Drosophila pseudoobscura]